jgi:hypothetical protein
MWMTLEEFEAALDLYGACVADWPEAQRLGAAAVLAHSAEARTMLAATEEVSTLLVQTRAGPGSSGDGVGIDRIVALATARPQQRPPAAGLRLPHAGWRYAACVAVALTGFALGVADGLHEAAPLSPIVALAFGPLDPFDAL